MSTYSQRIVNSRCPTWTLLRCLNTTKRSTIKFRPPCSKQHNWFGAKLDSHQDMVPNVQYVVMIKSITFKVRISSLTWWPGSVMKNCTMHCSNPLASLKLENEAHSHQDDQCLFLLLIHKSHWISQHHSNAAYHEVTALWSQLGQTTHTVEKRTMWVTHWWDQAAPLQKD